MKIYLPPPQKGLRIVTLQQPWRVQTTAMLKNPGDSPRLRSPVEVEEALARQALDAQVRMLPYALAFFGICLPIFAATAAYAPNAVRLLICLGVYGFNWAVFYGIVDWLKREPEAAEDLKRRTAMQIGGGLLWAVAVLQTSYFALGAGPYAETLLVLCAGAAVGVIFFSSPSLASLLLVGPIAAAGPIIGLRSNPETAWTGLLVLCGSALALALALILNRHLREHFTLNLERDGLIDDREAALKDARRLAKSKSDIVATLSHEIRNGLSGVAHVLAGALGAGSRGSPSREQLKAALHAARDLVDVLDATLDSETADSGRLLVTPKAVDADRLVQDMVLLHRQAAAAKGLEIVAQVEPIAARGAVMADSARLRQILNNLVGNAVKYTLRGRIEVRASLAAPDRIRFEVADTGPGLSADELAQAFEPFTRISRTGAGIPGAGLGLSLSHSLAVLMGGALTAESAPGVGSRFALELPFDVDAAAAPDAALDTPSELPATALRVLIAEDDALNAAMLRAVLEQLGHRVLLAQDGQRALELLKVGDVDLVMLDGRMPVLDGPACARAIRQLEGDRARLPIVAVIGGDLDEAQAMTDAGCDAVLRKPVTVSAVARAVADAASADRKRGEEDRRAVA
jgi:signal transduction histidine kinase/ActR/RegA family two-component response regulator